MHGISSVRVDCAAGSLSGRSINGTNQFRGVPYANAPTGSLRFEPPVPLPAWRDVLDATSDGPIAPQTPSRVYAAMGPVEAQQAENCLTLTIWSPSSATSKPVIVWFHGGGFMSGAGSLPWYDGERLARRCDAVVVNVNYRLGALGFLCLPGKVPGNLAVLDQEQALRWVQNNIEAFGGDPSRVTVMGQSGGGHNIAMLLGAARTEGLFAQAILLSPPLGIDLHTPDEAARAGAQFVDALDGPRHLKEASIGQVLAAQVKTAMANSRMAQGDLRPPFMPARDGIFRLPGRSLTESAAAGAAERGIPVMIGWTRDEANLFYGFEGAMAALDMASLPSAVAQIDEARCDALIDTARSRRPDASAGQLFMDVVSDVTFRLPALAFADELARLGGSPYVYQYDGASPDGRLGACHCIELPFLFGTYQSWMSAPILSGAGAETCARRSEVLMRTVSAFVNDGFPDIIRWQPDKRRLTHIDMDHREAAA